MLRGKIENGQLHIGWYRNGNELVFAPVTHDPCVTALAGIIEQLTERIEQLERLVKAAVVHVDPD